MAAATKGGGGYALSIVLKDGVTEPLNAINKRIAAVRAPFEAVNKSMEKFTKVSGLDSIAKGLSSVTRGVGDFLRKLLEVIPVLGSLGGAASLAGIYALASSFASVGVRLDIMSQRMGVSAGALQQLEKAAQLANVPAEALDGALQGLRDTMVELANAGGSADQQQVWKQLGFDMKQAGEMAKDPIKALELVGQRLKTAFADPTLRSKFGNTLINNYDQLAPMLNQSAADYKKNMDAAASSGLFSPQDIQTAKDLAEAQNKLKESVEGVGNAISLALSPALTPLLTEMSQWLDANRDWIKTEIEKKVKELRDYLNSPEWAAFKEHLKDFARLIQAVLLWIWRWKAELLAVFLVFKGAQFAFALTRIAIMTAAYVGLGKAAKAAAIDEAAAAAGGAAGLPGANKAADAAGAKDAVKVASEEAGEAAGEGFMGTLLRYASRFGRVAGPAGAFLWAMSPSGMSDQEEADRRRLGATGFQNDPTAGGFERYDNYRTQNGGTSGGHGLSAAQRHANEIESFKFWQTEEGGSHTPEQAAGLVAQEKAESDFDPSTTGDGGAAVGSFQWHPDRQGDIATGAHIDVAHDLNHMHHLLAAAYEMRNKEKAAADKIHAAQTAFESGSAGSQYFERPGDVYGEAFKRGQWAKNNLARLKAEAAASVAAPAAAGPPQTVGSAPGANASKQNLDSTVFVTVRHVNPPPGTTISSTTSGPLMAGPAKIETALPSATAP